MRKRLIRVGNSLALVIDIPIRKMMGVAPSLEVELSFEGRRIIIDPVEEADASCRLRRVPVETMRTARKDFDRLIQFYGITELQFQRIVAGHNRRFSYSAWLVDLREMPVEEFANLRRINACVK